MKKTLALILSLALALSSMTVGVFAAAEDNPPADPAVNVLDESVPADQDVQDGDVVTEQPADTDVDSAPEAVDPVPEATDPALDEDVVPQDEEEDVAKNSLLDDTEVFGATAEAKSSTSATVKWTLDSTKEVTKITVTASTPNKTVEVTDATAIASGSTVVDGLTPGTKVSFTVVFTLAEGDPETVTTDEVELSVDAVKGLAAYSAYKSVALEWDPVNGASSYKVYRNGKPVATVNTNSRAYDNPNKMAYIDKTGDESETKYSYYVTAVVGGKESAPSATVRKASVTQLYIKVTFKKTRKLKSHDKAKKKRTFKKGTTVYCHSFKFGKYIFYDDKGHLYYCNYMSLKKFKALTAKGAPKQIYSDKEAEYFVQTANKGSSTNYTIWANLYSQHLYVLTRANKNSPWRVANNLQYKKTKAYHWNVSSGKADTPSPAGMSFTLKRHKKLQRGVKWLTFYHSQTSLHGKVGNQGFNTLRSGGCIRNPDKYALLIYKAIPLKTRLIVY